MKLIIQSDDLGITEAVSCGIARAAREGAITCTGLFSNMPAAAFSRRINEILSADLSGRRYQPGGRTAMCRSREDSVTGSEGWLFSDFRNASGNRSERWKSGSCQT